MKEVKGQEGQTGEKVRSRNVQPYQSKACAYGALKWKYELKYEKNTHLIFLPGKSFTQTEDTVTLVRVEQIIRKEVNKIGGEKPVIFTMAPVFRDAETLVFTYFSTIK